MNYTEFLLQEKYLKSVTIKGVQGLEVFVNPSQKEMMEVVNSGGFKSAKGLVDKKGEMYVFTSDIEHRDMAKAIGLPINGLISIFVSFNEGNIQVYQTNLDDVPIRDSEKIYDRVVKKFPKAILKKLGLVLVQTDKGQMRFEV